ncbi:hypothetical protein [Microbacterium sp. NPDC079176]|uniref:hypothetical protein n=1 Tax=Microbacterium sp. NPDC079176 TaxID=3154768 RepID=UPI00342A5011
MTIQDRLPITAWVRSTGLTLPGVPSSETSTTTGRVMKQGETFEITPELFAETLDRNGNSFLDLDEAAQVQRYGRVLWSEGEPPADMAIGGDDDLVMLEKGLAALKYAKAISDPSERAAAVKAVFDEYGQYMTSLYPEFR